MPPALVRFSAGLVLGLVVGFFAANYLSRSEVGSRPAPMETAPSPPAAEAEGAPLSAGELDRAMEAVDRRPDDYEAQFKMGEALLRLADRPEDAIRYYRQANTLRPTDAAALIGLGDASFATALQQARGGAFDTDLLDQAAEAYESVLEIDGNNSVVRATLGMTQLLRTPPRLDLAESSFRMALVADRENVLALQGLASTLARSGDLDEANRVLAQLERVAPGSPALERARADLEQAAAGETEP